MINSSGHVFLYCPLVNYDRVTALILTQYVQQDQDLCKQTKFNITTFGLWSQSHYFSITSNFLLDYSTHTLLLDESTSQKVSVRLLHCQSIYSKLEVHVGILTSKTELLPSTWTEEMEVVTFILISKQCFHHGGEGPLSSQEIKPSSSSVCQGVSERCKEIKRFVAAFSVSSCPNILTLQFWMCSTSTLSPRNYVLYHFFQQEKCF